ncbi:BaiN/RdsA family NAD(P)/FAD-dependent oxidoreductase [Tichowtungia aerotolerans]|uniref:Aminoacetone oxidase family FAD-binding enzyme n=1 Tax=Tichowtungia aerotolerans TaxID=2697043 RepID=A0A6P1MB60_9BACT|nr:NAD(P)/FAD-dependent oxidoreductase [Tichowtungia aerotolerans]QHI69338.1 aminoacetone oxidase family FAD-binding enzyme [Tichowtungia aerotolerans]
MYDVIIIGGGAAGMFAAAVLAEEAPELNVLVLEKGAKPLAKVRVSGGGRCNLTHVCSDIREFIKNYPRGGRELIGPFNRFGPAQTVDWFEWHGVPLVTLDDGCLFPESDSSESVIDALLESGAKIRTNAQVAKIFGFEGGFNVKLTDGEQLSCRKLLVATGGGAFVEGLGHTIEPCVPSLFTFNTSDKELTALSGIVVEPVQVSAGKLKADGALLITHQGVSGPAVLRLSSFGARTLAETNYRFEMKINWLPDQNAEQIFQTLEKQKAASPKKQIGTWSPVGLVSRLWKLLVARAGIDETREWGGCSAKALRQLAAQISGFTLPITGKNRHREEFVTCGGIRLKEVNFQTMESRLVPGLYVAGEVLDIDALTGGFNLQAAWTTGYLAAQAMMI